MGGAIAAGHELTARAGAEALAHGGNAVDAAVAAAAMSWAAEPALTGPCGGGFMLVRPANGAARLLDAFTAMPGKDLPADRELVPLDVVSVPFDERTSQVFHIGSAACAVPGVVAGLHAAHSRYGRLPWRSLLLPAADAAQAGIRTNRGQYRVFEVIRAILTHTPEACEVFAPHGRFLALGEPVCQPDLASSMEQIAERGPEALYSGELAQAMVRHQQRQGGRLTAEDLGSYRPAWRRPLRNEFAGHHVLTNPPPSSGGVLIAFMLSVLDGLPQRHPVGSAPALRQLAETMRAAGRLRDRRFARLLHAGGLARHALSGELVERARREVSQAVERRPSTAPAVHSDRGTTHISVVDQGGNAAALTASNGSHSGVIVPGTGLHLNNMLGEEDLMTGRDLSPGARLTSMQAPSVVVRDDELRLVVGSSGSNRLRSAITQVVQNVAEHGMDVEQAVRHPRVHVEGDRLDCESGFSEGVLEELEQWGEKVVRFHGLNLYFGGTNAVAVADDGTLSAAGDPRRECFGMVLED
jgi:gamma-glutamyltranspeptidase / glutathione hydrolase